MKSVVKFVRSLKVSYSLYNLSQFSRLQHNLPFYKKLGLKKSYFSPVSSEDFPKEVDPKDLPWLDVGQSKDLLPNHSAFLSLERLHQEALLNWSENGYAILKGFFKEKEIDFINEEVQRLLETGELEWKWGNKLMFAFRKSEKLRTTVDNPLIGDILSLLLGKQVKLWHSINFYNGSEQAAHSDTIHMTTFPLGYLIAVWIALEDITEEQGPLFYYPGSHQLPYVLNPDYQHGGTEWSIGDTAYRHYEKKIDEVVSEKNWTKKLFLAKKGDLLIWHGNLLHGGCPILNKQLSRKSMVLHYFAEGVVCYHEITQRPALMEE